MGNPLVPGRSAGSRQASASSPWLLMLVMETLSCIFYFLTKLDAAVSLTFITCEAEFTRKVYNVLKLCLV